ncbi:PE family protein [Nocardia altamirensis]|uniref:PE family protein n=1 Tax=Nocardia altamirensis TaxID=472158 RepID=UPI00083FEFC4|nr:PE family protein [Nocardia altamirensis]
MFVQVEPEALDGAAVTLASITAQLTRAITSTAVAVSAVPPAGVDDASLAASGIHSAHGAEFVAVGAGSQAVLGRASAEMAVIAGEYRATDLANAALLA